MPMSNPAHMPIIAHYLMGIRPRSVLDVGIGVGMYGLIARQYLDISDGNIHRSDWTHTIDGVEIYEPYRNPIWSYFYNNVTIGNIANIIDTLDRYEVVLCNDVLEHFPRDIARTLISRLMARCDVLIATTPNREFEQGAWGGNEAETHHCLLTEADFPDSAISHTAGVTNCYIVPGSGSSNILELKALSTSAPKITFSHDGKINRLKIRAGRLLSRFTG